LDLTPSIRQRLPCCAAGPPSSGAP
jgi:hypothetical protein